MSDIIEQAIAWAKAGIPVFPCSSSKRPITKNGFYDASVDPEVIIELFSGGDYMIGGRMGAASGLFAVDLDLYKPGEAGVAANNYFKEIADKGWLTPTQTHLTANGGVHMIYAADTQPNCKPSMGVEVKGEGGYIILPPSPGYTIDDDGGFAEASPELVASLIQSRTTNRNQTIEDLKDNIRSGKDMHDSMTSIAAKLFRQGSSPDDVFTILKDTLKHSFASDPNHERHDRWSKLMTDSAGEVSRIINSGRVKYDQKSKTAAAKENVTPDVLDTLLKSSSGMFATPPGDSSPNEGNPVSPDDYDGFPFEGEGYFASDDTDVNDQRFNIFPVYAESETVLIAADPKAGKTAFSLRLAWALATGRDFGPLKVTDKRAVLYFALEGTRAIKLRLEAQKRKDKEDDIEHDDNIPLFVVEQTMRFIDNQDEVVAKIVAASRYFEETTNTPLGLVVIDTLTKAMPGADQNSVEDTSKLFEIASKIRDYGVKATVAYIHHTGKDGRTRGSSNIDAEVDVVIKLKKNDDSTSTAYIDMARSIEDHYAYRFGLESYELGETNQGIKQAAPIVKLLGAQTELNTASDSARRVMAIKPYSDALVKVGEGNYTFKELWEIFKRAGVVPQGRLNSGIIRNYLSELFTGANQVVYGGYVMSKKEIDGELRGVELRKVPTS